MHSSIFAVQNLHSRILHFWSTWGRTPESQPHSCIFLIHNAYSRRQYKLGPIKFAHVHEDRSHPRKISALQHMLCIFKSSHPLLLCLWIYAVFFPLWQAKFDFHVLALGKHQNNPGANWKICSGPLFPSFINSLLSRHQLNVNSLLPILFEINTLYDYQQFVVKRNCIGK